MDNPLEKEASQDVIERVHEFARDLVYGFVNKRWNGVFQVVRRSGDEAIAELWRPQLNENQNDREILNTFKDYLKTKWQNYPPSVNLLLNFDYLTTMDDRTYTLTEKSFRLFEKPVKPPTVFISYRRSESSAFALLIEARLKMAGNPNPFVDKNLVPGEEWHAELEQRIKTCKYFICLIGKTTLDSEYVRKEIEWAAQGGCTIISIWHGDAEIDESTPEHLKNRHIITVKGESALDYEIAITQLLSSLGYSTY